MRCCDAYLSQSKELLDPHTQSLSWDPALGALLREDYSAQQQLFNLPDPPQPQPLLPVPAMPSFKSNADASLDAHTSYQLNNPSFHSLNLPQQTLDSQPQAPELQMCMWGNCGAVFSSLEALVSHVNSHHLRIPSPAHVPFQQEQADFDNLISCHWGNCQLYSDAASVPGSSNNPIDAAIGVLAKYLYHDHLGLQRYLPLVAEPSLPSPPSAAPPNPGDNQHVISESQTGISHPLTPPADHD